MGFSELFFKRVSEGPRVEGLRELFFSGQQRVGEAKTLFVCGRARPLGII
jgi:hypothetical protein